MNQTWVFMTAATTLGQDLICDPAKHQEVTAYIGGVVDSLAQLGKISDFDVVTIWGKTVRRFLRVSANDAATLVLWSMTNQGAHLYWMQVGGRAVREFLSGQDKNAPLTLFELVRHGRIDVTD